MDVFAIREIAMEKGLDKRIEDFAFSVIFAFIPLILFVGLLVLAGTTFGAPNVNIEHELELTDAVIERVEGALPENPSSIILDNLDVARNMQADAHAAYDGEEFMLAIGYTRQAREIALGVERMIAVLGSGSESGPPDAVLRVLEQNAEMIEDLAPAVDEFGDDFIRQDFAAAVEMQDRAWQAFDDENYGVAGELSEVVRNRLLQIKKAVLESERRFGPENVASELERARELVGYAGEKVFPEAVESKELLSMAEGMLGEAEMLYSNGRPKEAMRLLDEVVVLSKRSIEISRRGGLVAGHLEEEIARTEDMIDGARDLLEAESPPEAGEMLSRAEDLLMEAQSAFGNGSVDKAEKLIIESRRLADLGSRAAKESGDINRWNVERAIDNTNSILEHVSGPIEERGNQDALRLLSKARELQMEAKSYLDDGKQKEALTSTRAAADAARQSSRIAGIE